VTCPELNEVPGSQASAMGTHVGAMTEVDVEEGNLLVEDGGVAEGMRVVPQSPPTVLQPEPQCAKSVPHQPKLEQHSPNWEPLQVKRAPQVPSVDIA
jgi:hypothetical protein